MDEDEYFQVKDGESSIKMSRIGSEEVADKQISSAARFNLSRRSQTQDMSSPVALQKAKKGVTT